MSYAIQRIIDGMYLQLDQYGRERWVYHATDASCSEKRPTLACQPGERPVTLPDTRPLLSAPGEFKCS